MCSASRKGAHLGARPVLAAVGVAASALAGCSTTQQMAARLRLDSARLRASQYPVRVRTGDPEVHVSGVALVRGRGDSALVVTVQNLAARSVSDLPISAGVTVGGRRIYLNQAPGLDYFQNHLPSIPARGSLRWVLATARALPSRSQGFAAVGGPTLQTQRPPRALPRIVVTAAREEGGFMRAHLTNRSSVPQYQLQIYAVAQKGGRVVGAAQGSLTELSSDASGEVNLRLVGKATVSAFAITAPPTIFS